MTIVGLIAVAILTVIGSEHAVAAPAPSADTARRCMRYAYITYPYKRPGSVRGSGDRQAYYKECVAKDGNVPEPAKN